MFPQVPGGMSDFTLAIAKNYVHNEIQWVLGFFKNEKVITHHKIMQRVVAYEPEWQLVLAGLLSKIDFEQVKCVPSIILYLEIVVYALQERYVRSFDSKLRGQAQRDIAFLNTIMLKELRRELPLLM